MLRRMMMTGAAGGGLWTPLNLAVLPKVLADDQSSITTDSGKCTKWNDRSGAGVHMSNDFSSLSPAVVGSGLNGLRTLSFNGSNTYLRNGSTAGVDIFRNTGAGWGFCVFKRAATDGSAIDRHLMMASNNATGTTRFIMSSGRVTGANKLSLTVRRLDSDSTASMLSAASGGTAWTMIYMPMDWANGDGFIYTDGALTDSNTSLTSNGVTSNTAANDALVFGAASNAAGGFFNGEMAAMVLGSGSLPSAGEIDKLFGYYAHRYALTGNLDSGHPYKTTPPNI